jgi:DNA-binding CsgD family transcriptional regulator
MRRWRLLNARSSQTRYQGAGCCTAERAAASSVASPPENAVLVLLMQRGRYRDLGAQLVIVAKTIEHLLARIAETFGVRSRADVMRPALEISGAGPGVLGFRPLAELHFVKFTSN